MLIALGIGQGLMEKRADAQATNGTKIQVPRFEADPTFPKPLPSSGTRAGRLVSAWTVQRSHLDCPSSRHGQRAEAAGDAKTGACCSKAPPLREFHSFSRAPCYGTGAAARRRLSVARVQPRHHRRPQGQRLDRRQRRGDSHILKFTQDGKFVASSARRRVPVRTATARESFGRVAKIFIDGKANEAYIADGYFNKRVAVIDTDSGK